MTGQPVDETTTWTVDPTPLWRKAVGFAQLAAWAALGLLSGSGPSGGGIPDALRRPRLPSGDGQAIDLTRATVTGSAPWMPPAWAGSQTLICYSDRIVINPKGFDSSAETISLRDWQITEARPKSRLARGRLATTSWVLTLTKGPDTIRVAGPWLTLAWMAHLSGWQEPPRP